MRFDAACKTRVLYLLVGDNGNCGVALIVTSVLTTATVFQVFETSEVQIMADAQYSAATRVQVLLEYLHEREMDLEDLGEQKRTKLEQCVQLRHFETEARQVRDSNLHFELVMERRVMFPAL